MSYKNQKLLKKKRTKFYFRISLWSIFVVTIIAGISFWSYQPFFQIDEVSFSETKFTDENLLKNIYKEESNRTFLMFFSKNTFFSIPEKKILNNFKKELTIESAFLKKNSLNSINFEIKEHKPVAVFCLEEKCYFANNQGYFFTEVEKNYLDQIIELEKEMTSEILGQNFSDHLTFQKIFEVISLLEKIEISIIKIKTEDSETFNLLTNQGPEIIIEKNDDPTAVVNNLKTTLEQEDIHENQFKNLEYLDLRFEDKVYYKIR